MSREAQVVDVLRSFQRDDLAIRTLEENIQDFSKVLSSRTYRSYSKFIPYISSFWYYYVTSGNNLQTLGEEYSNIIRLSDNAIPNKLTQVLWLSLYIGGEPLLNRLISYIETQVKTSGELREEARLFLMKIFSFWHSYNSSLKTIHRALFYISGKYFSVSHRITE
ncbi:hypothetical protein HHI36_005579 [Cryptolaemus montrouzieri]|uniref:RING-type E3 ubiquitin transferase n=1 Tax=Cryptolaemus montrouzieri TaxID=559131 RepID=A0ABD2NUV0_9CUCU